MRALLRAVALVGAAAIVTPALGGQWPAHATPGVPRLDSGDVDFDAPTPRTADGTPDFSGVWYVGVPGPPEPIAPPRVHNPPRAGGSNIGSGWGGPPLTAWGEEELARRMARNTTGPRGECLPLGVVQSHTGGGPRKFVQTPGVLVILYEFGSAVRQVFTDGRTLPTTDPQPWW